MFWPRKDFPLRCFIDAVVNTTLDVSRQNIRADLGRTFSASAALPMTYDAPYAVDDTSL